MAANKIFDKISSHSKGYFGQITSGDAMTLDDTQK